MDLDKKNKIYRVVMLILITSAITFMITTIGLYNYYTNTKEGNIKLLNSSLEMSEVADNTTTRMEILKLYLEENYIGTLDEEKMIQSAMKGYVAGLEDEYTEYLTKEEYEELMIDVTGNFVGIGIYMSKYENGDVVVLAPIEGSPAEEAGLQTGDIIVTVNGEECNTLSLEEVANKIKGEEGTFVKLKILRGEETIEIEVERKTVVIQDSSSEVLDGNIGYIQLITFDEKCTENVEKYLDEFETKGINKVILDLRDNTGGIVTEATGLAELFIKKGDTIMITHNKGENKSVIKSENLNTKDIELVVLVNEMSASASEILTGALKDNKVATIIGTTTYGKGVIQEIVPMFEGALKITTDDYSTELNESYASDMANYKRDLARFKTDRAYFEDSTNPKWIYTNTGTTFQGKYSNERIPFKYYFAQGGNFNIQSTTNADKINNDEKAPIVGYSVYSYKSANSPYSYTSGTTMKYNPDKITESNPIKIADGKMAGTVIENTAVYVELTFTVETFPGFAGLMDIKDAGKQQVTVSRLIDIELNEEYN